MALCHEFGVTLDDTCHHPMVAGRDSCQCDACGQVCKGRFAGCPDVWARGPQPVASPEGDWHYLSDRVPLGPAADRAGGTSPADAASIDRPPPAPPLAAEDAEGPASPPATTGPVPDPPPAATAPIPPALVSAIQASHDSLAALAAEMATQRGLLESVRDDVQRQSAFVAEARLRSAELERRIAELGERSETVAHPPEPAGTPETDERLLRAVRASVMAALREERDLVVTPLRDAINDLGFSLRRELANHAKLADRLANLADAVRALRPAGERRVQGGNGTTPQVGPGTRSRGVAGDGAEGPGANGNGAGHDGDPASSAADAAPSAPRRSRSRPAS